MSANLYRTCVFWLDQRGGRAKHDGVEVHLHHAPRVGKVAPRLIEFAPEVHLAQIAETAADAARDMTPAEVENVEWLLNKMAAAAREVV